MTIGENMYLGNERGKSFSINWNETYGEADKYLKIVGLEESSRTLIKDIGVGKQQLVEIAKALAKHAKLLILDEPTASLNEDDSQALLDLLLKFKEQGMTSIIISHKLNEISYVNAEAYCAGELKHGTISLITEGVPIIAIATQENVLPKLMANVEEVKARGAHVIVVTDKDMSYYEGIYDDLIQVPATDDLFATFASTVALQLLAYHVTVFRGYDVDQPRNLAKSVTVE